jgi:glycosyltransferase involved in cell wall biosynthesis
MKEINYGGSLSWQGRLREAAVLRAANAVTAASLPMIRALASRGIGARRVPLGVDLDVWRPREPSRREPDGIVRLIHVASLNRVKDQTTLMRALARLSESELRFEVDVVGEDTLAGDIQALARRLGLADKVRFHGYLTQGQLRPLVEAAHLMVIASRHEAGPLAVLEAAVVGVPTVGTAVGHVAEWSPQAARSVKVGDWEALANAIAELIDDETLRLRIARAAFELATREDADFTAREFESLYDHLTLAK